MRKYCSVAQQWVEMTLIEEMDIVLLDACAKNDVAKIEFVERTLQEAGASLQDFAADFYTDKLARCFHVEDVRKRWKDFAHSHGVRIQACVNEALPLSLDGGNVLGVLAENPDIQCVRSALVTALSKLDQQIGTHDKNFIHAAVNALVLYYAGARGMEETAKVVRAGLVAKNLSNAASFGYPEGKHGLEGLLVSVFALAGQEHDLAANEVCLQSHGLENQGLKQGL